MAHPLSQAILECATAHMAWPVGAEQLAEFCDYRIDVSRDIVDSVEVWKLAAGTGIRIRKPVIYKNTTPKISLKGYLETNSVWQKS